MNPNELQKYTTWYPNLPRVLREVMVSSTCDILYTGLCLGYVHYFYWACLFKVNTQQNYNVNGLPDALVYEM